MFTRRSFAGFVPCALCALPGFIATGVSATEASAQTPNATTPGIKRTILSQTDGPTPGYVTLIVQGEVDPGVLIGRHTHPGIESGYIAEGAIELPIEGKATKTYKAGEAFQVPPNTPHAGAKNGAAKTTIISTYVVEKGKPLASPA